MIKCSNCGFKNSDDDIYCVRCAKKLSDNNDVNDKTVQLNELYYSFLINEMKNKNNETKPSQQIHDTNKIQQQIKQPQPDTTTATLDDTKQPQEDIITTTSDDLTTTTSAAVDEVVDANKKQTINQEDTTTHTIVKKPTPIQTQTSTTIPTPTIKSSTKSPTGNNVEDNISNNNNNNATYFGGNEVKKSTKTYIGGVEQLTSKRQAIATILSMIFIGLGFVYLRNMQKFITYIVLQVVMLLVVYLLVSINISGNNGVFDLIFIINMIIYLYSIVDSYKKAGE